MSQVKDPVCEMMVDSDTAPAHTTYESQDVYFCSDHCRKEFEQQPERFADKLEREPPFTVSKGFVAPKFGSAGSGGLEFEPSPERKE
jgi:YHS domain-containing protein